MKKSLIVVLIIAGILIFGFILIQLFSVYIYNEKNTSSEVQRPGYISSDSEVGTPSYDTPEYNNSEGSKVQKTGSVSVLVKDIDKAAEDLNAVNAKHSGEITNIYDYGRGNDRYIQLTVKVPVDSFEDYYNEVREMDGEVTYANVGTNDLTERYTDITSRLANLKKVETQLVGILERASTVEETLAVQKELNIVRGDIESYEAQKRYFDSQTDYSYITVTFSIDKEGLNIVDEPWKPSGEFRAALNALVSFTKTLVNAGIWVLVFSPIVLIPVGIILYITKRKGTKKA